MRIVTLVAAFTLLAAAGCGAEEGIGEGAVATVYSAAGACGQAKQVLVSEGGRVGDLGVRVVCLPSTERNGRFDLAQIGANARRAVQDSSTIAYIGELKPTSTRFSETILREAGIAQLPETSGSKAMQKLLAALGQADTSSGSLRESVNDELY